MSGGTLYRFAPYTINGAAALLGVDDSTAYSLAARGWLPSRRQRKSGYRFVSRAALRRLVAEPRFWIVLDPQDIPDPELRIVAMAAREQTPGRWWAPGELAAIHHVHVNTIGNWRREYGWGGLWERWGPHWWLWAVEPPPTPIVNLSPATLGRKHRKVRHAAAD